MKPTFRENAPGRFGGYLGSQEAPRLYRRAIKGVLKGSWSLMRRAGKAFWGGIFTGGRPYA